MSVNDIVLRQASQGEWPAVAGLLESNGLPLDGAQPHLSNFVLAKMLGQVVGCGGAELYGEVALLRSVAVKPGLQRQGIGRLIVGLLLDEAQRRRVREVYLLTATAPEYFAQFGFKRIPRGNAPAALQASAQLQGACPACADLMRLILASHAPAFGRQPHCTRFEQVVKPKFCVARERAGEPR